MQKICAEVLLHFRSDTPESPLYWRRNASQWYSSTLLEKCWLYVSIESFEDFLVDQYRQFQNTPNSRIDSFRFFGTYIHPCNTFPIDLLFRGVQRLKYRWERLPKTHKIAFIFMVVLLYYVEKKALHHCRNYCTIFLGHLGIEI